VSWDLFFFFFAPGARIEKNVFKLRAVRVSIYSGGDAPVQILGVEVAKKVI